jgi:hypothetical protein
MLKKTIVLGVSTSVLAVVLGLLAAPLFAHPESQVAPAMQGGQGEGKTSFGCKMDQDMCVAERFAAVADSLVDISAPAFAAPVIPQAQAPAGSITATYTVISKGKLTASLSEFKSLVSQTLHDSRGWAKLGINFKEVSSGGEFTLVLSEASQVPTFSPGCDSQYSCRVGSYVIINEDRWNNATPSWNKAGGSLRDYRHMVINHEVGHWLGHGHYNCGGAGQKAPVMQQQSIDLQGCKFNPWPLKSELNSPRYGI